MSTLATFLIGMVGPLAARILASLGLGLVSMLGATAALDSLKSTLTGALAGLPADAVNLAGLFGCWTCIGMLLGAWTFAITWANTKGFWALAKA